MAQRKLGSPYTHLRPRSLYESSIHAVQDEMGGTAPISPRLLLRDRCSRGARGLSPVCLAGPGENVDQGVISLAARVLEHGAIRTAQGNDCGPRFRPRGWIVDRKLVLNRVRIAASEVLGNLQGLGICVLGDSVRSEIGGLDDERVTLPMAPGVSMPPVDISGKMRTAIQGDDARLAAPFRFNQHVSGTLNNLRIAVVLAGKNGGRSTKGEATHS